MGDLETVTVKRRIYANGKQFKTMNKLWNPVKDWSTRPITPQEMAALVKSVDRIFYDYFQERQAYWLLIHTNTAFHVRIMMVKGFCKFIWL